MSKESVLTRIEAALSALPEDSKEKVAAYAERMVRRASAQGRKDRNADEKRIADGWGRELSVRTIRVLVQNVPGVALMDEGELVRLFSGMTREDVLRWRYSGRKTTKELSEIVHEVFGVDIPLDRPKPKRPEPAPYNEWTYVDGHRSRDGKGASMTWGDWRVCNAGGGKWEVYRSGELFATAWGRPAAVRKVRAVLLAEAGLT